MSDAIPADVRELLSRHLASMDYIETLLTVAGDEARSWTPEEVAVITHATPASVTSCLESLVRADFVTHAGSGFRYAPSSTTVRQTVKSLEEMYRTKPVTLIKAIYERRASPLQSFADAFRVRKADS